MYLACSGEPVVEILGLVYVGIAKDGIRFKAVIVRANGDWLPVKYDFGNSCV